MPVLIAALLVLGAVLLVIEAHLPTYGVVGLAGVGALATAIAMAVTASGGSLVLALALTLPMGAAAGGVGLVAARKALAVNGQRARCGAEGLIGHVGVVRRPLEPLGQVFVDGALWRARPSVDAEDEPPAHTGERVIVERVQGLTLSVRRAEEWELQW
jgi:membrane-bound ClpP family serine protease